MTIKSERISQRFCLFRLFPQFLGLMTALLCVYVFLLGCSWCFGTFNRFYAFMVDFCDSLDDEYIFIGSEGLQYTQQGTQIFN